MKQKQTGFTLLELLIVLGIIAILAAIAYPSYMSHVRTTQEAHQKEGAMQASTLLERMSSSFNAYPGTAATKATSISDPNGASVSLPNSSDMVYTYTPDTTFTLNGMTMARGYSLQVDEATSRFKIQTWINSAGTRCFCSSDSRHACGGGSFTATTTSCTGIGTAF